MGEVVNWPVVARLNFVNEDSVDSFEHVSMAVDKVWQQMEDTGVFEVSPPISREEVDRMTSGMLALQVRRSTESIWIHFGHLLKAKKFEQAAELIEAMQAELEEAKNGK